MRFFMITIHDLETILEKPQPKEGGAIGPVSTLLQVRKNSLYPLLIA